MKFESIGIINRSNDELTIESINQLIDILNQFGCNVIVSNECPISYENKFNESDIARSVDLIITVGGDGTILHAANLSHDFNIPLLGINRGQLGFLADLKPEEMKPNILSILNGNYSEERRMMLRVEIIKSNHENIEDRALNDIVLQEVKQGECSTLQHLYQINMSIIIPGMG